MWRMFVAIGKCGRPQSPSYVLYGDIFGMAPSDQPRVLVVNHSPDVALLLKLAIQDAFPTALVETAINAPLATERIEAVQPQVIVLAAEGSVDDVRQLAQEILTAAQPGCRLVLSGNRPDMPRIARELGAIACLHRPARLPELESAIRLAMAAPPTQSEDVEAPEQVSQPRDRPDDAAG